MTDNFFKLNKRVINKAVDVYFNRDKIRNSIIDSESIEGNKYKQQITYMEESLHITKDYQNYLIDASKEARIVLKYIVDNLEYNATIVPLNSTKIAKEYNVSQPFIINGIKQLVEKDIIRKVCEYVPNTVLPKNTYSINFNYLYKGNLKEIIKIMDENK